MNRLLRLFTILLLIASLPLNGMAGVDSAIEPCPMQTMGMEMMAGWITIVARILIQDQLPTTPKPAKWARSVEPRAQFRSK